MNVFSLLWNLFLAYAGSFVCRVIFILQNGISLEGLDIWKALCGALLFDNSAVCYTLSLYALLMLLPLPVRGRRWYQTACKWYYIIVCGLSIVANLADSVYFPYAGRRTTGATLIEFRNESAGNILRICGIETARNWWLVLLAAALIAALWFLYRKGTCTGKRTPFRLGAEILIWLACLPLIIGGIRGGFTRQTRPINIGNAMRYVNTPEQAAAILNTPFAFIRNIGNGWYTIDEPRLTKEEVDANFSAIHQPSEGIWRGQTKPNVFIIIAESLSEGFIGAYNDYPCGTPFLDSLRSVGLSPREALANGNKSIDALPSILSSIPRMEEHLVLTPYANNKYNSIVTELGRQGYESAFFHGASAGSMGFDAFGSAVGIRHFYSYEDYCRDTRFGGSEDFDGHWAIWDEEFLQFTALHASDLKEPFISTVFTASSHHPFLIPDRYKGTFNRPGNPMYNCISYLDWSLKRFFETASAESWYDNTLFVIIADHGSTIAEHQKYRSDPLGDYRIPIIIFSPSGMLPRGIVDITSQQTDIFPTLMGIIGTDRAYIAFGKDFLCGPDRAYLYNETHTFIGETDSLFRKAFIQDYKTRMIENRLNLNFSE